MALPYWTEKCFCWHEVLCSLQSLNWDSQFFQMYRIFKTQHISILWKCINVFLPWFSLMKQSFPLWIEYFSSFSLSQMVSLLLSRGANINAFDKKDRRAIHWAAYMGMYIFQLLISVVIKKNHLMFSGFTYFWEKYLHFKYWSDLCLPENH